MLGRCIGLVGLWLISFAAFAISNSSLIDNLKSRIKVLPQGGSLIRSIPTHSQSYIYDQALAIIAFTEEKNKEAARDLLLGLEKLQNPDGSLYFSYYMDGTSPYPAEGDRRLTGAIAWVAIAAATYQKSFKTDRFKNFNSRVLVFLDSQMKSVLIDEKKRKAIRFAPTDIQGNFWDESEVAALEHNLDAYAAYVLFQKLNPEQTWNTNIEDLKSFLLSMWDADRNHFWSGVNLKSGLINKDEIYLDNQTWTLLVLDKKTLSQISSKEALAYNCDILSAEHEGIIGLMDSKPTRRPPSSRFVWSEGTAGQALAMKKINNLNGENLKCNDLDADGLAMNIEKMEKENGGIAYSTPTTNPDFTTASSVAGTAWLYFVSNNINPFGL